MNPRAAQAALRHARKVVHDHSPDPTAHLLILDAMDELLRYTIQVEVRLNQHLVGGQADHPELVRQ